MRRAATIPIPPLVLLTLSASCASGNGPEATGRVSTNGVEIAFRTFGPASGERILFVLPEEGLPDNLMRQGLTSGFAGDLRAAGATISVPTVVIHGSEDEVFPPAHGRDLADPFLVLAWRSLIGWGTSRRMRIQTRSRDSSSRRPHKFESRWHLDDEASLPYRSWTTITGSDR